MANSYSYQVIKDDTQYCVIKLTGSFDGTGQEENLARIQANTLSGALNANTPPGLLSQGGSALPYYGLTVNRVWYDSDTDAGDVQLYWRANNSVNAAVDSGTPLFFIQGNGEFDAAGNWASIHNPNVTANTNGDISIKTRGYGANTSYTILLELRKQNEYYQRGQFNDPAAFNYPPYGLTPN